jgi:hypothetical protein
MRLVVVQSHIQGLVTALHTQPLVVEVDGLSQQQPVLCLQANFELVVALDLHTLIKTTDGYGVRACVRVRGFATHGVAGDHSDSTWPPRPTDGHRLVLSTVSSYTP